ncbi:GNAT family N-acetyltransferase [Glutamicibacter sp. NPDC087344]|uniref:GNAT family N-acetyltransferase n=1 Tax=Glutamicibacter sp. NPDC087344 TaxID=3363994 RepID=UPI003800210D
MAIHVRTARRNEYEAVAHLALSAFGHTGENARAATADRLSLLHDTQGRAAQGEVLVAEDSETGALSGTVTVLPAGVPYSRQAQPGEAEVRLLAVDSEARQRGVGWLLLEEAARVADLWDAEHLVLDTAADNQRSRRLYDGFGYERQPWRDVQGNDSHPDLVVYAQRLWGSDIVVRQANSSEYADVAELTLESYESDYSIRQEYREALQAVSSRATEHQVWIAAQRSTRRLLGTVTTPKPGANVSELGQPDELDFRFLAIAPHAKGQGIGTLLISHVEWLAAQRGLQRVVLNSGIKMFPAHSLYGKLGYRRLHLREREHPGIGHVLAFGKTVDPAPSFA